MPSHNFAHLDSVSPDQAAEMRRELRAETPSNARDGYQGRETARASGDASRYQAAADRMVAHMRRARGI